MRKILFLLLFLCSNKSLGFEISVNPGQYQGTYRVMDHSATFTGSQQVNLGSGIYNIQVGAISSFQIIIDDQGIVTVANGISALGGEKQLTFMTSEVQIDAGFYTGDWQLPAVSSRQKGGVKSLFLVNGLNYLVQVAAVDGFSFYISDSGIESLSKEAVAEIDNKSLKFNTTLIGVSPQKYQGNWSLPGITDTLVGVKESIYLVPHLSYQAVIGAVSSFRFQMNEAGKIEENEDGVFVVQDQKINFNTLYVDFRTESLDLMWSLAGATSDFVGPKNEVSLVQGLSYRMDISQGDSEVFSLDEGCLEANRELMIGDHSFQLNCYKKSMEPVLCEMRDDVKVSCRGTYVARNEVDLESYIEKDGFIKGAYRNLKVKFSPEFENLEIHSKCKIVLQGKAIKAKNICLDAQKGVVVRRSRIYAGNIFLFSSRGRSVVKGRSFLKAEKVVLRSKKASVIKGKSIVEAETLELESQKKNKIGKKVILNIAELIGW